MSVKLIKPIIWILLITSCYTSVITNSWHSENNTQKVYKKILVVALVNSKSYLLLTENMENHLAADLNEKGITSISSFKVYGPKAFNGLTENEVLNKIEKKDIDAVLTIVLLDKEKEKYYVPGRVYYTPYNIYHRRFWGYYSTMYERIYEPGYYEVNTNYFWESNFYDMTNKELIYSVQTKSFNPENVESLAHEYGKIILNDLYKTGVLK